MSVKTTIAIIGATGNTGAALAASLSKGPYRLLLMAEDQEKLTVLQQKITLNGNRPETEIMLCAKDACWEADVIIPAVSFEELHEVAGSIREVVTGKIVISLASPVNSRHNVSAMPAGEALQQLLPHAKLVNAYITNFADVNWLAISCSNPDCFLSGNDEAALETVSEMARVAGFHPVITRTPEQ